jgi:hypothetical protein
MKVIALITCYAVAVLTLKFIEEVRLLNDFYKRILMHVVFVLAVIFMFYFPFMVETN